MLVVAAATFGLSLTAQTCEASANTQLTDNAALLSSPRYREDHPELLRGGPSGEPSPAPQAQRLAVLTRNAALASSPLFREEHPEFLRAASSQEQAQVVRQTDQPRKLTVNKALEASPRYRETHPSRQRKTSSGPGSIIASLDSIPTRRAGSTEPREKGFTRLTCGPSMRTLIELSRSKEISR